MLCLLSCCGGIPPWVLRIICHVRASNEAAGKCVCKLADAVPKARRWRGKEGPCRLDLVSRVCCLDRDRHLYPTPDSHLSQPSRQRCDGWPLIAGQRGPTQSTNGKGRPSLIRGLPEAPKPNQLTWPVVVPSRTFLFIFIFI